MNIIKKIFSYFSERKKRRDLNKEKIEIEAARERRLQKENELEGPNALPIREFSDEKIGEKFFKVTVYGRNALERLIPPLRRKKVLSFREELPLEDMGDGYDIESPFIEWNLYSTYNESDYSKEMILEMYHSRGYAGRIIKVARVFGLRDRQDIIDVLNEIEVTQKTKDVFSSFV